jgi:hypothetical protein
MMVLFLVCLSWNALLWPLLWQHRELFFGWTTVGANVGGTRKIRIRPPNIKGGNARMFRNTNDVGRDRESPKDCSRLKSCECFYTCPRAPFYRETKGLLHSENTLEPKEYS